MSQIGINTFDRQSIFWYYDFMFCVLGNFLRVSDENYAAKSQSFETETRVLSNSGVFGNII